ncbi:choice-of-anchor D domain-containing protein [Chitinophagaceae bacterium LB-8]|uniref:Choice-of-anchor D domain-containing protein n=1 Tax=Paraflavisolibacter caeni TaxID=2982496 RepID=A0A9X3B9X1_9BACT|nr:kelch repeat-containing protein [Paraflavisolibacter caeni]MCU7551871.1 choice-of-anchor D domain-containing protein [Paraflavisolibacter caeni]
MKPVLHYKSYFLFVAIIGLSLTATFPRISSTQTTSASTGFWNTITPVSGAFTGREENSYVAAGDKFYLIGGRGIVPVQEYNPINKTWVNKLKPPIEINHFQAVTLNGLIYVVAAMNGAFPHEIPLTKVLVYNPVSDKWFNGSTIPSGRRRGAAGTVVYKNKIYLVGGITDGHWSGWVNWFDEYDPATNTWKILPNAPHARDHFQAVVINDKLYIAGGRRSSASTNQTFQLTVPSVDVFDFVARTWSTLPSGSNLPVPRAGAANAVLGNEVIVIGGESGLQLEAHKETHALNVTTNTWRRLADLQVGRHGTGVAVSNQDIYIAAGASKRGGTPLDLTQEDFFMVAHSTPNGTALTQSSLSASSVVNFGSVVLNTESSQSLTIANSGTNQDILITSINITGASSFKYAAPYSFPFTISPGRNVKLTVKFKPPTTGTQTASLVITHSGQSGSKTVSLTGTGTTAKVSSFSLINATTNQVIRTMVNNDVISLASDGTSLNIKANTSPATVGSVVFNLTGAQNKNTTESIAPYALFADNNGDYYSWTPPTGSYTLKATPYSARGGTGTAGSPLTIAFSVTNQATSSIQGLETNAQEPLMQQTPFIAAKAFPNPANSGSFTVLLPQKWEGEVLYTLVSAAGNKAANGKISLIKTTEVINFDFSREMIAPGFYYLYLQSKEYKTSIKLMKEE